MPVYWIVLPSAMIIWCGLEYLNFNNIPLYSIIIQSEYFAFGGVSHMLVIQILVQRTFVIYYWDFIVVLCILIILKQSNFKHVPVVRASPLVDQNSERSSVLFAIFETYQSFEPSGFKMFKATTPQHQINDGSQSLKVHYYQCTIHG